MSAKGAMLLGMSRWAEETSGALVPLAIDASMSKLTTFEAGLIVARVARGERSVNWFSSKGSIGAYFVG